MQMSTTHAIDLDAYFRRIGHTDGRAPDLDTLAALHLRHAQAIAFENLNPLTGWPVPLDPVSLERKLVHTGRGGYCFEQNLLFGHVLTALGFRVTDLGARVLWNQPEDAVTPRSHMLLLIDLDRERYIADVGFGVGLTAPLRLAPDASRAGPLGQGRRWLDVAVLDRRRLDVALPLRFTGTVPARLRGLQLLRRDDPSSHFRSSLLAARPAAGRRYALLNNRFTVHYLGGPTERRAWKPWPRYAQRWKTPSCSLCHASAELDAVIGRLLEASLSAAAGG